MTTVAAALAEARRRGVASLDAQLLLAHLLATTRTRLIADDERTLAPAEATRWEDALVRRLAGEPIAYLLGEKEFHGLMLEVDRRVLVPRPETELLVDWASETIEALTSGRRHDVDDRGLRVVDLGTGSGAIALALKNAHPRCHVTATDVSRSALAVARRNAERLDLAIELVEASWWQGLEGRRFQLAVANPPYIAADDPHLRQLGHEPALALTPGGDGLDALRAIVEGASASLEAGSWLLLEHGFDQAGSVRSLLAGAGFGRIDTRRDLAGHERATGGRRAPP
ncbi:MAG TPA: peptide chain release factor N(5)-glutamine methyltransferase [Caldimonas sp.]|nr:peptide chain release factor N(5)-glutamine methyltransferase [Caldimonas sp.]